MKTLLIAEHDNQSLKNSTLNTYTAAQQLNHPVEVLIAGHNCQPVAALAAKLPQVAKVLIADNIAYEHHLAENMAQLIASIAKNYDYILMPATTLGKDVLPRAAALTDVSMLSDIVAIKSADTFVRPIYAGNILATVQSNAAIKFITVRTTAFAAAKLDASAANIETLAGIFSDPRVSLVKQQLTQSARPELTAARVIVSGGRGLKSAENFKLVEKLADKLQAAVGASRAAVDAGFAPNDYQVGQTGKIVAPELYIAIGISGAIQHLAGMKDSKVIVAINNDPDAPIFEIADYGLVGDLFSLLPELEQALENHS